MVASPRRQALGKEDLSANQLPPFEEMSRAGDGSLLSRKLGTRDLGFIHCPWALLFCQVDFFNSSYARSNQQLDAAQVSRSQTRDRDGVTRPVPARRCGVRVPHGVPACARPANRQGGGRSSVRFDGVVMATARAGARAASPRGLRATERTPPCPRGCGGRWGTGGGAEREEPVGSVGGCGLGAAGRGQPRGGDSPVPAEERGPVAAGRGCCEP